SSSAHLVFFQHFFRLKEPPLLFDSLLHFSTFLVTIIFFWARIKEILKFTPDGVNAVKLIFIASLPTAIIGFTFGKIFERAFNTVFYPAFFLLITGLLLWVAEKKSLPERNKKQNIRNAFLVGLVQGIALLPGISRSGSTISTGIILGWSPTFAAEFSFLLSLPAIFGVTVIKLLESNFSLINRELVLYLPGMFFAFLFGLLSLKLLWRSLLKHNWKFFSYYCWFLGLTVLILAFIKR
ncbi:MAG TPA: undecaprenyl-diphosphatase, partial [Elusimicrobia bacterium]|nr:undecaprenyl-diphosphatase [Elusimicrobiota bacterium]